MDITLRDAVIEDCERIRPLQEEIARLHHAGRPELFRTEARYFTREEFAARLNDPKHMVCVAQTADGTVVGYAFAWVVSYRGHSTFVDFDSFYLDDICVLKAYQRNGIGRQLFERCKQRAKEQNCKTLELGVWSFNTQAIAFYESCGMTDRIRRMELRLDG